MDDEFLPQPPEEPGIIESIQETVQAATNAAENIVGKITMVPVVSSDIAAWGYDPLGFKLQIQFTNGRVYIYQNISPLEFESLVLAASKGQAFWALIRRNPVGHPFTRVQ